MIKGIVFDGGGTIWYSMEVLYEHYKMGSMFYGLIPSLDKFPYSLKLMNELSSLRSFNSRKNIAKIITALLMKNIKEEELDEILESKNPEGRLLSIISDLIPNQQFWTVAIKMGDFLEKALYNYPEEWYPLCKGIRETLPILKKKYKLAILSNRRKHSVIKILKANKIYDMFDYIQAPDEGEPLRKDLQPILKNLGIKENEIVFVGDSILDVKSAKEMGNIKVIATLSGMGTKRMFDHLPEEHKPDCIIDNISELTKCICI